MNKIHYLFLFALGLLLSAGCLCGCIKDDLSDCPEPEPATGLLRLALTYTMHDRRGEDGTYADRFSEQVHKVDVFVFGGDGRLVEQITDEAAPRFPENYTKDIELPAGEYRFVVWGNHYAGETVHNCTVPGVSTPEDSRLTLVQTVQDTQIRMLADSLFHGCTAQPVTVANGTEQTVSVDLMKNRNDVRVVVRWLENGRLCTRPEHAEGITVELTDNNATYDFLNRPADRRGVTYLPGRFPEWYNPSFHDEAEVCPTGSEYVHVADFSELRLMKDNPDTHLVIRNAGGKVVYERALTGPGGWFSALPDQYPDQEAFDREDAYLIELEFACEHKENPDPDLGKPWVAVTIRINGWIVVERDIEL